MDQSVSRDPDRILASSAGLLAPGQPLKLTLKLLEAFLCFSLSQLQGGTAGSRTVLMGREELRGSDTHFSGMVWGCGDGP